MARIRNKVFLSDEETKSLIVKAQKKDKASRDYLFERNTGLVAKVAEKMARNFGEEFDDLFQVGCIGLLKAIDKFDLSFDVKFSTYAVPMIEGEIRRYNRDKTHTIKTPRSVIELNFKATKAREAFIKEYERTPKVNELAEILESTEEEIILAMGIKKKINSINEIGFSGDDDSKIELQEMLPSIEEGYDKVDFMLDINRALKGLQERQALIIKRRYVEEKTQVEVAEELGLSQVQISRIERKAIEAIRTNLNIPSEKTEKIDITVRQRFVILFNEGLSRNEIMAKLRISESSYYAYKSTYINKGILPPDERRKNTGPKQTKFKRMTGGMTKQEVFNNMYEQGKSKVEIIKALNIKDYRFAMLKCIYYKQKKDKNLA